MTKSRVIETNDGIQGEIEVAIYDTMQRRLRDKGWIETKDIIKSGITAGVALEIGPGPGYLGLEWLKNTEGTTLKGVEISPDMIKIAQKNAEEYGFLERTEYVLGTGNAIPLSEGAFDAAFSNGSLHEWENPEDTFNEMWRMLKPGGRLLVSDLRRDMNPIIRWFMWISTKPKEIRPGLITSIKAAYTPNELERLLGQTDVKNFTIKGTAFGIVVTAMKE